MAPRAPTAASPKSARTTARAPVKPTLRGGKLTATFSKAAKRAVADHAAAGRSVFGKVSGRLTEVRPTKSK